MSELKKVICPNCGKELEIPAELEAYSCLYCGERTELSAQKEETAAVVTSAEGFEQARAELRERLPKVVTRFPDYYKKITKKEFFGAYEYYENENRVLLKDMDACAVQHPDGVEVASKILAGDMLDGINAAMTENKRWKHKNSRDTLLFETKVILAIFLTTAVRKLGLQCSESFRTELHDQWLERYPKQNWMPGDYDDLATGFKKHKLCFITTAICSFEGKPDDCAELTAFRAFRDGWLTEHGGAVLIEEYYDKAPAIVNCINLCDVPEERYAELRSRWLEPCYRALQEKRFEDCRDSYVDMVRTLERRYLS